MAKLEGAVVVVTGAARGIGRAIAEELGQGKAKLVVNYAHSKGAAEDLVAKLLLEGSPEAVAIQADVSDPEQAARLIEETIKHFGRIDVLVNNAGINVDRSLKNMTVEAWRTVIEADLSSYFYTIKAALPFFTQQRSGTIINMSSIAGQIGKFGQSNYSAAKAGILGLTKAAALELARYNVTVNWGKEWRRSKRRKECQPQSHYPHHSLSPFYHLFDRRSCARTMHSLKSQGSRLFARTAP